MTGVFVLLGVCALFAAPVLVWRYGLPKRFPWGWAGVLWLALFGGGFQPLGNFERLYYFSVMLAVVVGVSYIPRKYIEQSQIVLGIILAVFVLADALRIIPTPDAMVSNGEEVFGGAIRRPYALDHPNLVAAWSLLLPFGWWTVLTVIVTQSRGAFLGLIAVWVFRRLPRRLIFLALIAGALLVALRPSTALARRDFWREGLQFFIARPVTGWGSGSYYASLLDPASPLNAVVERTGMHTAHNLWITIAAENGLIGLVPLIGLSVGLFRQARGSRAVAKWSLLAFAVQQIFDDQWLHPITSVILGAGIALLRDTEASPIMSRWARWRWT